jgi:formate dehydrogenase subunit gamma
VLLAHEFNLSRAEVYGTASFYHDFRLEGPAGRHVLKLCRAEACQAVGGEKLAAAMKQHLTLDWNETSADGAWTLVPVFCLGLCASGPSAMIDGEPAARLDDEKLIAILDEVAR